MSLFQVFNLSGSALSAQKFRLNTIASNLANADTESSTPQGAYRAKWPIFKAVYDAMDAHQTAAVKVTGIAEDTRAPQKRYAPGDPQADKNGYVYLPNINAVEEMTNMMDASRSYQINVEVMNTSKELLLRTLTLGS